MPSSSRACVRSARSGLRMRSIERRSRQLRVDAASDEELAELLALLVGCRRATRRSTSISYSKSSFCERIERYSPLPMENAPADESREAGEANDVVSGIGAREAQDERDVGDQAVKQAEERRAESAAADLSVVGFEAPIHARSKSYGRASVDRLGERRPVMLPRRFTMTTHVNSIEELTPSWARTSGYSRLPRDHPRAGESLRRRDGRPPVDPRRPRTRRGRSVRPDRSPTATSRCR